MSGLGKQQIDLLKSFISLCKTKPSVLYLAELDFFKDYIESLGATLPEPEEAPKPSASAPEPEPTPQAAAPEEKKMEEESEESEESDLELDMSCVIEPDNDPPQEIPAVTGDITEEMMDACNDKCSEGQMAMGEGNLEAAVERFTEALKNNPGSARAWSKRACVYIKLSKPNAAHRDCDKALEINPDSAQGLKWRGRANMLLGNWAEALSDLSNAQKIDYDEQCGEWLKHVMPNANKLREHKHKYEMKRDDKERKKKLERLQKAKEAREKAMKEEEARRAQDRSGGFPGGFPGGMPGGMPGFPGGMPGGMPGGAGGFGGMPGMPGSAPPGAGGMPDLGGLLNDPELLQAFQDPEVAAAFQDISQNPGNMPKYQNNPKIKSVIDKLTQKFGGGGAGGGMPDGGMPGGGMPGGMPGGFGGMPGFPGGAPPSASGGSAGSSDPSSSTFDVD